MELALILPILVLFLMLALDFGRVFFGWVSLNNAARIAANAAATHPSAWDGSGNPNAAAWQDQYRQAVANDMQAINCDPPGSASAWVASDIPDPTFPAGYDNGDHAVVTLHCDFHFLTPLVGNILGNPLTISAHSEFAVRGQEIGGVPLNGGCVGAVVPNIVGQTVANARGMWFTAGFDANTFTPASGSDTDIVTAQTTSPASTPGQCLATNSAVTVTHSPAVTQCTMPSMVTEKVNSAQSDYTTAGFTGTFTITRPPNGNYNVTSQNKVGGQLYDCSTSVTVAGN